MAHLRCDKCGSSDTNAFGSWDTPIKILCKKCSDTEGMMKIGDCYEASAKYVLYEDPEATLVHGIPLLQTDGKPYGHSWVEKGDLCIDVSNGKHNVYPMQLFYGIGKIDPNQCKKYTAKEVNEWILKTEHWGPWELVTPR